MGIRPRWRTTEERNPATVDLDLLPSGEIVAAVVAEDLVGVRAVAAITADIGAAVDAAVQRVSIGGHIHLFGAGASGRLALLDATEASPTFGVPPDLLVAHFPGGADAFFDSSIDLEDATGAGRTDAGLLVSDDVAIGVTASGSTPYVGGALAKAGETGSLRILVTMEPEAELAEHAEIVLCAPTGPEAVTGSTRLKAGTATKSILNAFSTALMVRLGRTYSNLMVGLVATNAKLHARAVTIVAMASGLSLDDAAEALDRAHGDPSLAIVHVLTGQPIDQTRAVLRAAGSVREAIRRLDPE